VGEAVQAITDSVNAELDELINPYLDISTDEQ
jgi:hypothetical protein